MSHMLPFYGLACCYSLYSCSPTKHAHHSGWRPVRCQDIRPQNYGPRQPKELTWQEHPTHTIAAWGVRCPLKEEAALWALGRLTKDRQVPLRTKTHVNIKTKKSPREAKEPEHQLRTWNQPAQNQVPPLDPILTNPKLGLKQLPTLTAWTTKGKLETPWQQQLTLSAKQQEPWQKAEAMSQSPRFLS